MTLHPDTAAGERAEAADTSPGCLRADGVTLGYGGEPVVRELSLDIPTGGLTVVIGPNGCGKSTLLKALGRVVVPTEGRILLHGTNLRSLRGKAIARRLALLPQNPIAPERITVRELVGRSRYPHHSLLRQWSEVDDVAVGRALERTDLVTSADHPVGELSGGQRQRAWFAMVLAQETDIVLLDEPTTFLDIAHQFDLLELCAQLHRDGRTIVAVLHDLNQAARYATHLVVMNAGTVVAQGPPAEVLTAELVTTVFGLDCDVIADPHSGSPLVIPMPRPLSELANQSGA